jgi:hypothetical protein
MLNGLGWIDVLGWIAACFTIATYAMKTMIPLRILGIVANGFFVIYALTNHSWPTLFLYGVLLPLNSYRLRQMLQLTRSVKQASRGDLSMDWLKPFSSRRQVRAGEVLFERGAPADAMFYVLSGRLRLLESGVELGPGDVVGELGMVAPERSRTQTVRADADGELLVITYGQVRQLYFQNPTFGFYLLELMTRRLFDNQARATQAAPAIERGVA